MPKPEGVVRQLSRRFGFANKPTYMLDYLGRPPFFADVYKGRLATLEPLVSNRNSTSDPSLRNALVNTQIHSQGNQTTLFAACYGAANPDMVQFLLDNGANPTVNDLWGRTPLHFAVNSADPAIITILFAALEALTFSYFVLHSLDTDKRNLFHYLCMPGSSIAEKNREQKLTSSLELLLSQSATKTENLRFLLSKDKYGNTPVMYAQYYGYNEILAKLRSLGYDFGNIPVIGHDNPGVQFDLFGRSPLMQAAFERNNDTVISLLDQSSPNNNPTIGNACFGHMNALHYAARNGTEQIIKSLLRDPRTNILGVTDQHATALHLAAFRGDPDILKTVLTDEKIKPAINLQDLHGNTALHALAMAGREERRLDALEVLLQYGADLSTQNAYGDTAYDVAVMRGNDLLAKALVPPKKPSLLWGFVDGQRDKSGVVAEAESSINTGQRPKL